MQLGYTSITAPISGIAGLRFVDVGNVASPGDPQGLVAINQVQPISVLFAVPQAELPEIKRRSTASGKEGLAVEAWSQDGTRPLDAGRLAVINNQVDAASGTVTLIARFPNAQEQLWPGAFVSIRLVLGVEHDGLTVPAAALQQGPQGSYVWAVARDGAVRPAPVTVQQSAHGRVLLSAGVSAGEPVVTGGAYGLEPGAMSRPERRSVRRPAAAQRRGRSPRIRAVSGPGPEPSGAEGGETEKTAGGGLSAVFIARPTATIMLMLGVLLVGLLAYAHLPIASLPTVNVPTVLVTAELSGADAETNASAVTTPLEKQFGQIPGLTQMTSSSADSYSQITLQFSLSRSVDGVAQDVQAAINAAAAFLPSG